MTFNAITIYPAHTLSTLADACRPLCRTVSWFFTGVLVLFLSACDTQQDGALRANQGMLDLTGASLDEIVKLEGTWLAQGTLDSTQFAAYGYDDSHWQPVTMPSLFIDQGFPDDGLVWYRLHVRLPQDVQLKGFIEYAGYAHTLYVAQPGQPGIPVASSGHPAPSAAQTERSRKPVHFTLPADTALVLSWKMANFNYLNGGPFYAIYLGETAALDTMLTWRTSIVFAYACIYLLIAFFFIVNWFWYRRDYQSFSVGFLALAMALRTVAISGLLETYFPSVVTFEFRIWIEASSYFMLIGACGFLLWSFFPKEYAALQLGRWPLRPPEAPLTEEHAEAQEQRPSLSLWFRMINTLWTVLAMAMSSFLILVTAFTSALTTSYILEIYRWFTLGLVILALWVVLQAVARHRPMAKGMLFGFGLILAGGIHDVLVSMWAIESDIYIASHAFLGFVLMQAFIVARRNARYAHALRTATNAAQAAALAKNQFVTAVSHELRTPLTAISGYAQILQEELPPQTPPHLYDFLQAILEGTDRVLKLVNDLLDLAKVESGKLDLTLSAVSIDQLLADIIRQLFPLAEHKGLALTTKPHSNFWVQADALRLRQALINLVSNAIKFTEAGRVTLSVSAAVQHHKPACAIVVEDTGVGISTEFLPRLFDRFTQEMRAYTDTQRGTGLGLSLSRELIRGMGGDITVTTEIGIGSRFTITLPCVAPPAATTMASSSSTVNGSRLMVPRSRLSNKNVEPGTLNPEL